MSVVTCGRNSDGEVGQGNDDPATRLPLGPVATLSRPVRSVTLGEYHSVAVCADGSVVVWGRNNYGQLGIGVKNRCIAVPKLLDNLREPALVAAGGMHTLFVTPETGLIACGLNTFGQLGTGDLQNRSVPEPVVEPLQGAKVTIVAAGMYHTLVVCEEQRKHNTKQMLFAFGRNEDGQLGLGSRESPQPRPQQIRYPPFLQGTIAGVYCGGCHSAVVLESKQDNFKATHKLYVFGENYFGQLGIGGAPQLTSPSETHSTEASPEPRECEFFQQRSIKLVSLGQHHSLVLAGRTDAPTLYACGRNSFGQCGVADRSDQRSFVAVTGLPKDAKVLEIAAGAMHSVVLFESADKQRSVLAFGNNNYLQLGLRPAPAGYPCKPTLVELLQGQGVTQAAAGGCHSAFVLPFIEPPPQPERGSMSPVPRHNGGEDGGSPTSTDGDVLSDLAQRLQQIGTTLEEVMRYSDTDLNEILRDELRLPVVKRNRVRALLRAAGTQA
eukprot:TRINITY_DN68928_c0_g1_i1.p1 TRINITY_DN68928_c0_g1~~TRINITY_DN68928_c0_g1_i1.p1  ORF type:complete len:495 (+),score=71.66 TRINITY_DN68928_c0_g1_i1:46-1530(+)